MAHKSKKNKQDDASCETTTMDDLLGDIDQRKVVGGHVHTKVANLFKNKQEAYTKFGKDWKDRLVNGVVMDVEVQKTTKGSNYTYVAALYEIAHNVTIEKKLLIGLMKSGLAPGQENAAHKPAPGPKCRLGSKAPMPRSTDLYFYASSKIDQHNRIRANKCAIDKAVGTNDWSRRVNFSILSMIFTNTWQLYKATRGSRCTLTSKEFFELLAQELINTPVDESQDNKGTATRQQTAVKRKSKELFAHGISQIPCPKKKKNGTHSSQGR